MQVRIFPILMRFPNRPQTNYPLQMLPNVEERLLQLEGDKDSLHLQVRIQNSDISIDILSGCGLIIGRIVFLGRMARVSTDSTKER